MAERSWPITYSPHGVEPRTGKEPSNPRDRKQRCGPPPNLRRRSTPRQENVRCRTRWKSHAWFSSIRGQGKLLIYSAATNTGMHAIRCVVATDFKLVHRPIPYIDSSAIKDAMEGVKQFEYKTRIRIRLERATGCQSHQCRETPNIDSTELASLESSRMFPISQ